MNLSNVEGKIDWKKKWFFKVVENDDIPIMIDGLRTDPKATKHDPRHFHRYEKIILRKKGLNVLHLRWLFQWFMLLINCVMPYPEKYRRSEMLSGYLGQ